MKQLLLLLCLFVAATPGFSRKTQSPDPLAAYEGKYQMSVKGKPVFIQIAVKDKELTLTSLWDGQQNKLKHVSGDDFIISLKDWSVRFIRDKKGEITSVLVMGHDLWMKVK